MNAIQLLKTDHKKMKKLVTECYNTTEKDVEKRKKLFKIIKREAKLHEKMEEKYFYSVLKKYSKSRPNVFEHHEEIVLMEHMIAKLSKTPVNNEKWTAKFKVLKELNDHHIKEEEEHKFPQASKLLSKDLLNEIGEKMKAFKKQHNMK